MPAKDTIAAPEAMFPDILVWAIPVFVILVLAEFLIIRRKRKDLSWNVKDGVTSMAMGIGMTLSDLAMASLSLFILFKIWPLAPLDLGRSLPVIIAAFIAGDFFYYWKHRFYHRMRWWWMAHVVHHSSEHYNLTTALRQPWTNHITGHFIMSVPMVLMGFHPLLVVFVGALNLLYQFWIHTELIDKMPKWFEAVMNTPSNHRVHHGRNPQYLDTNYAGTFIIWDKMFGTFVAEDPADPPDYGLVTPQQSYNPFRVAFDELIAIFKDVTQSGLRPRQRLAYIFAPPGYSHDGSRQSSTQIKAQASLGSDSPASEP